LMHSRSSTGRRGLVLKYGWSLREREGVGKHEGRKEGV
jgi:hypothetical protein